MSSPSTAISIDSSTNNKQAHPPATPAPLKFANPACVGLGGFALTTFVLQLHNLNVCGIAPVIACGFVFGGAAQLFAGLMEFVMGNAFGFAAFTGYGAFWISFAILSLFKAQATYEVTDADVGSFLVAWTIFTFFLFIGSSRRSRMEFALFATLLLGLIFASIQKFTGSEGLHYAVAWDLMLCAWIAFYCFAHCVLVDVFGEDVLPLGPAVWTSKVGAFFKAKTVVD